MKTDKNNLRTGTISTRPGHDFPLINGLAWLWSKNKKRDPGRKSSEIQRHKS